MIAATPLLTSLFVCACLAQQPRWDPGPTPPPPSANCVIDGQVVAVGSARHVATGTFSSIQFSPSGSRAVLVVEPQLESAEKERDRLSKGDVLAASTQRKIVILQLDTGRIVQVGADWDGRDERVLGFGWIGSDTLVVPTYSDDKQEHAVYLADCKTGAVLGRFKSETALTNLVISTVRGDVAYLYCQIAEQGVLELRTISRDGIGEPFAKSVYGMGNAAGILAADGQNLVLASKDGLKKIGVVGGKIREMSLTADDERVAHEKPKTPSVKGALVEALSPVGKRLFLKSDSPAPFQPSEAAIAMGTDLKYQGNELAVVYSADGVVLWRSLARLSGPAAERVLDANEQEHLRKWAQVVISEWRSFANGFEGEKPTVAFPAEKVTSFAPFKDRLTWIGRTDRLAVIRGERFEAVASADGKVRFQRRKSD